MCETIKLGNFMYPFKLYIVEKLCNIKQTSNHINKSVKSPCKLSLFSSPVHFWELPNCPREDYIYTLVMSQTSTLTVRESNPGHFFRSAS